MTAIHMRMARLRGSKAAARLHQTIERIAGVSQIAIVASAGVISVMFDETVATAEQIVQAVRSAGFNVRMVTPAF